jgi:hypothetical protein
MAAGSRQVIASTIFNPGVFPLPVVAGAYMRNMFGSVDPAVPDSIAAGHYRTFVPGDLDPLRTSITHRATDQAGVTFIVSVVLTRPVLPAVTPVTVDIFVRTDGAVLSEAADPVEVTLSRLPL